MNLGLPRFSGKPVSGTIPAELRRSLHSASLGGATASDRVTPRDLNLARADGVAAIRPLVASHNPHSGRPRHAADAAVTPGIDPDHTAAPADTKRGGG